MLKLKTRNISAVDARKDMTRTLSKEFTGKEKTLKGYKGKTRNHSCLEEILKVSHLGHMQDGPQSLGPLIS